jgi:3(or 17)beta-hydroxysteroid dehydrogenase
MSGSVGRLEGKVCVVTGASSGIGAASARLFANEGAKVILTDVQDQKGEEVARGIGEAARFFHHDVSQEKDWQQILEKVSRKFGRLDVLVNNAGVLVSGTVETSSIEDFHRANAVMVDGVFLGCKYAIAEMKKSGGGSIVNLSSIAAQIGQPHFLPYSAAKGAVRTMTKSIAVHCQIQKYNIRCNSVHPGAISTPMYEEVKKASQELLPPELLKASPGGRADPSEVASMLLFLASDESRFVNGAEMIVDNALSVQ